MRAARTPPDPAPMTNRSTSCGIPLPRLAPATDRSELVVALLLHLCAHFSDHVRGVVVDPPLGTLGGFLAVLLFSLDDLLTERRFVEFEHLLQVLLGVHARIGTCDF